MASARVTAKGIEVTFLSSEVSLPGSPADQDDAGIERAFGEALAALDTTPAHVDAITHAQSWAENRAGELVQLFAWRPGVTEDNWRAGVEIEWRDGTDETDRGWWWRTPGGTWDILVSGHLTAESDPAAVKRAVETARGVPGF